MMDVPPGGIRDCSGDKSVSDKTVKTIKPPETIEFTDSEDNISTKNTGAISKVGISARLTPKHRQLRHESKPRLTTEDVQTTEQFESECEEFELPIESSSKQNTNKAFCRSARSQRRHETASGQWKAGSLAVRQRSESLNTRERILEQKSKKEFQILQRKLQDTQTELLETLQNLNTVSHQNFKNSIRLIAAVENDGFKVVVKEDNIKNFPTKLRCDIQEVVELEDDVKAEAQKTDESCANPKLAENFSNDFKDSLNFEELSKGKHVLAEKLQELEAELRDARMNLAEAKIKAQADCAESQQENQLYEEVRKFKNSVENIKGRVQANINTWVDKREDERKIVLELKERLYKAEQQQRIAQIQEKLYKQQNRSPRTQQGEQSAEQRSLEIEKINLKLSETNSNIFRLGKEIEEDKELLHLYDWLMYSLETNDKSESIRVEEMSVQVSEKNNIIIELEINWSRKREEFTHFCRRLESLRGVVDKQKDLAKVLEENNDRSYKLCEGQHRTIGRLEKKIANLKQNNSEKFPKLCSTLSNAQMELSRQELVIKTLEEKIEENGAVQDRNRETICHLEEEIAELKQTMKTHEKKRLRKTPEVALDIRK